MPIASPDTTSLPLAGPSIGAHLSDFGAEVIKVERPGERFQEQNAAGIRVADMADAATDRHYAARATVVAVPDDALGEVLTTAPVPRMSASPGRIAHAGRALGADDDAVLGRATGVGR